MKSSPSEDTVWTDMQPFINRLVSECRLKEYKAKNGDADPIVRYSFEQLYELTGHDWHSDGDGRGAVYDHREKLAWDESLYFDAIHGRGVRFTTNQVIGTKWYADLYFAVVRSYLQRLVELLRAAESHTHDNHLKQALTTLLRDMESDYRVLVTRDRNAAGLWRDLMREGDIPRIDDGGFDTEVTDEEGKEALKCEDCGDVWLRPVKRGRKPKRCPDCNEASQAA